LKKNSKKIAKQLGMSFEEQLEHNKDKRRFRAIKMEALMNNPNIPMLNQQKSKSPDDDEEDLPSNI
jgi:hypothetical protein